MTERPYRELECPDYEAINADLLDYVEKYTNLLTNDPRAHDYDKQKNPIQYPNFPDRFGYNIKHFVQANPRLIDWIHSYNLKLRDAYFTLAWYTYSEEASESSCPIHLDKPPVYWKLNWPILNMENTAVRFYRLKDPTLNIQDLVTRHGDPNSKDRDRYNLNYAHFVEIDRYRFNQCRPIIMNGMVPHDIGFYENPQFPRIGLQVMFMKEPLHLL